MRVMSIQSDGDRERLSKYCKFLIQLGDGDLPLDKNGDIRIPEKYLLPCNDLLPYNDTDCLIGRTMIDPILYLIKSHVQPMNIFDLSMRTSTNTVIKATIPCPKNVDVDKMNEEMMKLLATRTTRMLSKCR